MIFSEDKLELLKKSVQQKLSPKRFAHTLGVMECAEFMAKKCSPNCVSEIRAAALLHDITKELSEEEQKELLALGGIVPDEEDAASPQIIHSYTAPIAIKRDYLEFATPTVLSATRNHTLGAPDMSIPDEIIFLADFIEPNRSYSASIRLRKYVYNEMKLQSREKNLDLLHLCCLLEIDSTLKHLVLSKKHINSKNILTRNSLIDKIINIDFKESFYNG